MGEREIVEKKSFKSDHASQILLELNRDRKSSRQLCDLIISSGKLQFPAHRCVLATLSRINRKAFTTKRYDKRNVVVNVNSSSSIATLKAILDFLYTCEITITYENVYEVFALAEELKIHSVMDYCVEFLCEFLNFENCTVTLEFARKKKLETLADEAEKRFIEKHDIKTKIELAFLQLKIDKMTSDEDIYDAVITWVKSDVTNRKIHFSLLFKQIKLEKLSTNFLRNVVEEENIVVESHECLNDVRKTLTSRSLAVSLPRSDTIPNLSTSNNPMAWLYVSDLHHDVTEAVLYEKFSQAGRVLSIRVSRDVITRRSLGYGYVNFEQPEDAERALDTMNYDPIKGRPIHITWSQRDPSLRNLGIGNIFIKNLEKSIDNKALFDTFSAFGNILSCKVSSNENGSKGYGFVHFETEESAVRAIEKVNGMLLNDKKVFVEKFLIRSERMKEMGKDARQFTNIYIKNFGDKLDDGSLRDMFEKFGVVKSVAVMKDRDGNSRGFGFVAFEKCEDAQRAVEALNGMEVKGSTDILYVGRAQKKQEHQAELRGQFEQQKQERLKRFQGVNLYVKNLDDNVTDDELREAFSQYGTITSAKIMSDGERSRGFGFVCFSSPEEATKAVTEMNGRIVGSKPLYVSLSQRREDRKAHLTAQYMQRMTTNMGVRIAAPSRMIGQPFQATCAPGGYFRQFQGGQRYMPSQIVRATPRWQHSPNPQFQMGDMRSAPRGPTGPAIRPMTTPVGARGIHPSPHQMMQPVAAMQPFKYTQSVRNAMIGFAVQPQPQVDQQAIQKAVHVQGQEPLTATMLAAAQPEEQKQMLGECLYPLIEATHADLASKITGMLLEIDNSELLHMLDSPESLKAKIKEAVAVLHAHQAKVVAASRQARSAADSQTKEVPTTSASPLEKPKEQMKSSKTEIRKPLTANVQSLDGERMIREGLRPPVEKVHPDLFAKITATLLNKDISELQNLLESPNSLKEVVENSIDLLKSQQASSSNCKQGQTTAASQRSLASAKPANTAAKSNQLTKQHDQAKKHDTKSPTTGKQAQPKVQKNTLGDRLYPLIEASHPQLAPKITGMLLELKNSELLRLIDSPDLLKSKVNEAVRVLETHKAKVPRRPLPKPTSNSQTNGHSPVGVKETQKSSSTPKTSKPRKRGRRGKANQTNGK